MPTEENIKIEINGQTFYTRSCKYQEQCNRYNPALKIVNAYGVEHLNICTVGGGSGCDTWREETDKLIGWHTKINRG